MPQFIRLYSESDGAARIEDWAVPLTPEHPALDELSVSIPLAASAAVFVQAQSVAWSTWPTTSFRSNNLRRP
jgi:hypothetical protein